mgnify:CR=1 FL=1
MGKNVFTLPTVTRSAGFHKKRGYYSPFSNSAISFMVFTDLSSSIWLSFNSESISSNKSSRIISFWSVLILQMPSLIGFSQIRNQMLPDQIRQESHSQKRMKSFRWGSRPHGTWKSNCVFPYSYYRAFAPHMGKPCDSSPTGFKPDFFNWARMTSCCFHFVEHTLNFTVVSITPCNTVMRSQCAKVITNHVFKLSESPTFHCKVVKGLLILNPKGNVPSFVIFPTVHTISLLITFLI